MKKLTALFLALVMLMAVFAGCGKTPAASAPETQAAPQGTEGDSAPTGEITIWVWSDFTPYIEAYEAAHPNTKVNQVVVANGDYVTKIQTTIASGGKLPDIILAEILSRGEIFSLGVCENLSAAPYNFDESTIDASVLGSMKDEDGNVLGVELSVSPAGLAYQTDLAEQYLGTSDPAELTTMFNDDWDKFIEAGKKVLTDSDGKMYMFETLGDIYYLLNGQIEAPRISGTTINKASVQELFSGICKMRDAGIVNKVEQWTPAWFASFGAKEAVFSAMPAYGYSNWVAPCFEDVGAANWKLMVPPQGGVNWGGMAMCITKDSGNKALAWDFIKFYVSDKGVNDTRSSLGETVSYTGYYTDDVMSNYSNAYAGGQNTLKVYISEILPTIQSKAPTVYDFNDICTIELVLSSLNADGSMTAEDAVDLYISEMQRLAPELAVG